MRADIYQLTAGDLPLLRSLNTLFGCAFGERDTYCAEPPSDEYLRRLLARENIIVLVALVAEQVVGGLVAYELDKFERARRELYIYDLAVAQAYRRRGIATSLIERLRPIAILRGAWIIYVQADYGDGPAIALYEGLGARQEVLHFDIKVAARS
ncbi:MAG TPA: AAC(3)-I family aminoglycoside N-acetyltransferase [Burkholderiaceae bacterium]